MQYRNTLNSYGVVAKTLHWLIALLIIAVWGVGYYMTGLTEKDTDRFMFYNFHKSIGMAILMLVVIRWSWRLYNVQPNPESQSKLINVTANIVHYGLYVFMFIQPLSGWALSSAAGYNPDFFGWISFPGLVPKNPDMTHFYAEMHEISAYILLGLFILHVCGAWFHHLVLKDNTLKRMLK